MVLGESNKMYTVGEVSEMFSIPISTLRYYDKEGLFPNLKRVSGIRQFSDTELETLRVIECLKKSGLEIKDIKKFMDWCQEGSSTYSKRLNLFIKQKEIVEDEINRLNKVNDMIKFKIWYYTTAMQDGSEENLQALCKDNMPRDIWDAYKNAHE